MWPRRLRVRVPSLTQRKPDLDPAFIILCPRSSTGQSVGLRIRRLGVRIAPGAPRLRSWGTACPQQPSSLHEGGFSRPGPPERWMPSSPKPLGAADRSSSGRCPPRRTPRHSTSRTGISRARHRRACSTCLDQACQYPVDTWQAARVRGDGVPTPGFLLDVCAAAGDPRSCLCSACQANAP